MGFVAGAGLLILACVRPVVQTQRRPIPELPVRYQGRKTECRARRKTRSLFAIIMHKASLLRGFQTVPNRLVYEAQVDTFRFVRLIDRRRKG